MARALGTMVLRGSCTHKVLDADMRYILQGGELKRAQICNWPRAHLNLKMALGIWRIFKLDFVVWAMQYIARIFLGFIEIFR